jgi:hypothetical protein
VLRGIDRCVPRQTRRTYLLQPKMPIDPNLEPFNILVGTWQIEATHPMVPSTVVHGTAKFEWLEGERFLLQRSRNDHPEFPDSLIVFGADENGLSMNYFDSRGVHRVYNVSLRDGVWRMWRHAPGFSQKFNGILSADGDTIEGLWKLSRDDSTWDDDLAITFRRR